MMVRPSGLLALLLFAAACQDAPAPVLVLDQPEATLPRTFQQVSNVVELRDGRVALAELKDKTFVFADFASGTITPLGAHADTIGVDDPAPGRHKLPGYVLRLAGDTLGLIDFAAERTTLWNEAGTFLGVQPGRGVGGYNQPLYYDFRGHGYKEDIRSVLGGLEPGQEVGLDSLNVLRLTLGDTIADTVARLKLPVWGRGQFGEQMKIVSTIFSGRDIFGVLPDGSLWVARASSNSVDWRSAAGEWSRGPSRDYDRVPVTQPEKDAFLERLRGQMAQMGAPAGIELSYPFADEKPPFAAGQTDPSGFVWLQRSRPYGDSIPVWDVVGRDGRQVRAVQLPRGASVGGFGDEGRVYLILRDDTGQKVGRYVVK